MICRRQITQAFQPQTLRRRDRRREFDRSKNLVDSIPQYKVDNLIQSSEVEMRIGQLAAQVEVNVQTIRLYERLGLLKKPVRRKSGYREYSADAVTFVRFIRQAKALGFTLNEIKSLIDMREKGSHTMADMRGVAQARLRAIDERIRQLQGMRDAIEHGLNHCGCPEQFPACVFSRLFNETTPSLKEA